MGDSNRADKLTDPDCIFEYLQLIGPSVGYFFLEQQDLLNIVPQYRKPAIMRKLFSGGFNEAAWMFREVGRFAVKEHQPINIPMDSIVESQLIDYLVATPEHFIHISKDNPLYIAYTPSDEYGKQDRRVKTTVGRYIKKYFPDAHDLNIRAMSDAFRYYYGVNDVLWATTPAEIEHVYTHGPHTCMAYPWEDKSTQYGSQIHPSIVYAQPWFRIAYLKREGKINARCVTYINPEDPTDKRLIRVYGDNLLRTKLEALGYTVGNLAGARITKIPARNANNMLLPYTFICPYIDDQTGNKINSLCEVDDPAFLEIGYRYSFSGLLTTGLTGDHHKYTRSSKDTLDDEPGEAVTSYICANCGNEVHNDDLTYLQASDERVCSNCIETYYVAAVWNTNGDIEEVHIENTFYIEGSYFLNDAEVIRSAGYEKLTHPVYAEDTYWRMSNTTVTSDGFYIRIGDVGYDFKNTCFHLEDLYPTILGEYIHADSKLEDLECYMIQHFDIGHHVLFLGAYSEEDSVGLEEFLVSIASKHSPENRYYVLQTRTIENFNVAGLLYSAMNRILTERYPELIDSAHQTTLTLEDAA